MNTGNLQKRIVEVKPLLYDKKTRIVSMCVEKTEQVEQASDGDGEKKEVYSCYQVQIDGLMDYGHIKSQLIEAAFAQKDEFGFLMNAMEDIVDALYNKGKVGDVTEDIVAFMEFSEYRKLCADTAKQIIEEYV